MPAADALPVFARPRLTSADVRKALIRASLPSLIILGAATRWWSPAMKSDLWYNEAYSYSVAARPFHGMMAILYRGADTNPPLYTFVLHFWIKLGHSDAHIKLFSLMLGTASIAIFYLLARLIADRRAALVSCALFTTSQSVITYSVEARPYALFLLLSLLSTYFLLTAMERDRLQEQPLVRTRAWLCYAVTGIFMVYTHWFALLVLFVQSAALPVYRPHSGRQARAYLASLAAMSICCLPLAPFLWNQVTLQTAAGGYNWPGKPGLNSLLDLAAFLAGGKNLVLVFGLVLALACRAIAKRRFEVPLHTKKHAAFLIVYLVLPMATVFLISRILPSSSFFVPRYFLPFIVAGHLLMGLCLTRIDRRVMPIILLAFVATPLIKTARLWRAPESAYSQLASHLVLNSGDSVLVCHLSPMSYYPVVRYCSGSGPRERILWSGPDCCYEVSYNLRGGMLDYSDLIEVGPELMKYTDLWVIVDPIDRDGKIRVTYRDIRKNSGFILASEERVGGLRLEHYVASGSEGDLRSP